jgi:Uma2 family endonuclease
MLAMETVSDIPRGEYNLLADHRVVMGGVTWESYQKVLAIRGDGSRPRMAYLDGALELMTTSEDHERIKNFITRLAEMVMLEAGIKYVPYGEWTMRDELKAVGIEADECYRLGADQTRGRWPDLALEVIWTSGGIDKLEAYRRIGVREVWFWEPTSAITAYVLRDDTYQRQATSEQLHGIDLALVCALLDRPTLDEALQAFRTSLVAR